MYEPSDVGTDVPKYVGVVKDHTFISVFTFYIQLFL
jgi:hypothetical protein